MPFVCTPHPKLHIWQATEPEELDNMPIYLLIDENHTAPNKQVLGMVIHGPL
jgi:hypothetical protein